MGPFLHACVGWVAQLGDGGDLMETDETENCSLL